ncbi:MAG: T9SS type A sorting domain-containing protein [Bacteroidales bacterium]|nr:T9SS type A sorting domain-containing protein [Bacteroidales bacterium]
MKKVNLTIALLLGLVVTINANSNNVSNPGSDLSLEFETENFISAKANLVVLAANKCKKGPKPGWKDSYSAGGKCYCASNFDHGIGKKKVNTPAGKKTVKEVCKKIGKGPGAGKNPKYNDIQCGNGPANNAADEKCCPGRVDMGKKGCKIKGPKWDLSVFKSADMEIEASTTTEFTMFPNPAIDQVTIMVESVSNVTVFNIQGKLVYEQGDVEKKLTLDTQAFSAGTYFVIVTNEHGTSNQKLIIK